MPPPPDEGKVAGAVNRFIGTSGGPLRESAWPQRRRRPDAATLEDEP
jgi:hypothetical protein